MVETLPFNAGGTCSIPGQGAKIPHASWAKNQNIKQKPYCNKFNKDFKNGPHQKINRDFPRGAVVKNPPANAGDTGSIPGPGRSHMPRSN